MTGDMQADTPQLNFPATFCCNCGDTNCTPEIQDTRVTRGFGGVNTTFHLAIPICEACRKTLRRRPSGMFIRLLVFAITSIVILGALIATAKYSTLPVFISENLFVIGAVLALLLVVVFYRLRRVKPPQTSYYQPVRIKDVRLMFAEGTGRIAFMKLAFTNSDYLNVFTTANRDAIKAKALAAVKA
jgi:small-conductance mechanosensitive channel